MDKSQEAMLGDDFQKPKVLDDHGLEPTDRWAKRKESRVWDKEPTWWERGAQGLSRDYSGCLVNICYLILLIAECGLWIKVLDQWRVGPQPIYFFSILLPLILPSIVLPLLAMLHSLVKGRLSYSSSLLLVLPPSPFLLHILLLHRKLKGEEHHRISLAARGASLTHALLSSLPLLLVSMVTMVRAAVGKDQVDMASLHSHLYEHSLQGLAATLSLINLQVSGIRFNERLSGRAICLLVGLPFFFVNTCLRLAGFTLLLAYFDTPWILLMLGLHFCVAALGVQLGAGQTMCGRACRAILGVERRSDGVTERRSGRSDQGVVGALVLSLANCAVPCGYNRDRSLGHCMGRSWMMVVVTWIGSVALHCLIINQTIIAEVPNVYTGLAPVDLSMLMPKTGLAVSLPNMAGGLNVKLVLPQTQMTMDAEHPASYELSTSPQQDMLVALAVPLLLALLTLPFTLLRVILLGWDCALTRQKEWKEQEDEEDLSAGKCRNCLTVCCGVTAMMLATIILMLVVITYVVVMIQSLSNPLVRDLS